MAGPDREAYTEAALEEIPEIAYLEVQRAGFGEVFHIELDTTLDLLLEFPEAAPTVTSALRAFAADCSPAFPTPSFTF